MSKLEVPVPKTNGDYAVIIQRLNFQDEAISKLQSSVDLLKQPRSTNWQAVGAVITITIFLIGTICSIAGLYFSFRINEVKADGEKSIAVLENRVATMYSEAKRQEKYLSMLVQKELGLKPDPIKESP